MGRYAEADPLYLRAIAILTNILPENHPYHLWQTIEKHLGQFRGEMFSCCCLRFH